MIKKLSLLLLLVIGFISFTPEPAMAQGTSPIPGQNIDSAGFMMTLDPITYPGIEGSTRQSWIRKGVDYFLERIVGFMAAIIGTLAVLMISIGGFMMLSSAGNDTMYESGKNYVKFSLIGLLFTLTAYILVTAVQLLVQSIYA